jgi:hypothetical protein
LQCEVDIEDLIIEVDSSLMTEVGIEELQF